MAANNLAYLVPTLIGSIQYVARQTGFLFNAASLDATAEGAAIGQPIQYTELPDLALGDVVPGPSVPDAQGVTPIPTTFQLSAHKYADFKLTAEDNRAMAERGMDYRSVQIDNAVATVINGAETALANLMEQNAGVAIGTVGADPFAANPNILVDAWQGMADDRAPDFDRLAVLSTLHYGSAAKLQQFQKLNEAPQGTDFASGRLGFIQNWNTGYSQASGVLRTTAAGGGYLINNGPGYPAGTKTLSVDTGTGGFAAGDLVTIAGNVYAGTSTLVQMVVASATASSITLTRGLFAAVADNAAVVRIATHRSSLLAHRSATVFAIRPSAELPEGDLATITQIIRDPVTGIALRLAYYPGYHQGAWQISAVFGGVVRRPAWVRRLIS